MPHYRGRLGKQKSTSSTFNERTRQCPSSRRIARFHLKRTVRASDAQAFDLRHRLLQIRDKCRNTVCRPGVQLMAQIALITRAPVRFARRNHGVRQTTDHALCRHRHGHKLSSTPEQDKHRSAIQKGYPPDLVRPGRCTYATAFDHQTSQRSRSVPPSCCFLRGK